MNSKIPLSKHGQMGYRLISLSELATQAIPGDREVCIVTQRTGCTNDLSGG